MNSKKIHNISKNHLKINLNFFIKNKINPTILPIIIISYLQFFFQNNWEIYIPIKF